MKTKKSCAERRRPFSYSHLLTVLWNWHDSVLKSDRPTEFGKMSKKEKDTTVISKEKRMKQILQSNNENRMNWKQSVIFGVYLGVSFVVILFE